MPAWLFWDWLYTHRRLRNWTNFRVRQSGTDLLKYPIFCHINFNNGKQGEINMLCKCSVGIHQIQPPDSSKWCEFTAPVVSPAACFDSGPQLMDSSERQPLKWHYFRSVHKNCVAAQLLQPKWVSSVTEHQCCAWPCWPDQPSGTSPDKGSW